jgi:hypothetical protein
MELSMAHSKRKGEKLVLRDSRPENNSTGCKIMQTCTNATLPLEGLSIFWLKNTRSNMESSLTCKQPSLKRIGLSFGWVAGDVIHMGQYPPITSILQCMSESQSAIPPHLLNWARLPGILGSRLLRSRRSRLVMESRDMRYVVVFERTAFWGVVIRCLSFDSSGSLNRSSRTVQSCLRVPRTLRDLSHWRTSLKMISNYALESW